MAGYLDGTWTWRHWRWWSNGKCSVMRRYCSMSTVSIIHGIIWVCTRHRFFDLLRLLW